MKVLFVSREKAHFIISPIVKNQAESIIRQGVEIDYFTIKGKGFLTYVKNIFILRKFLKSRQYQIVHAHYSFCGFVALLARRKEKVVVSFMGSDIKKGTLLKMITRIFYKFFKCDSVIVKSEDLKKALGFPKMNVIPNGVNIDFFQILEKENCRKKLNWDFNKKHLLFAADPNRIEKNHTLFKDAIEVMNDETIEVHYLKNISHEEVPFLYNAADVTVLVSLWEGSPNVIKEGMACNCPIVSTDVGDALWVTGNTKGCFITKFDSKDLACKLNMAIAFSCSVGRTKGRQRIIELGLDSQTIAKRIMSIYNSVLNNKQPE